uniref:mediator of RNA polymerase II transcription subunit 15a n=1 Tax=Erigeron canadensis TaxID=72917 RepID=UPI001CB9672F|nr:mediator of RNA polymerase II transcription subunit 15a [Erigeron canadensis]
MVLLLRMYTLKRHLPFSGHEGLQELKKIAVKFEEKIYTTATSQYDYLRKISLKMFAMETRSQNRMPDAMQANSAANSINPSDPGSQVTTQANNQGQQLPIPMPPNDAQTGQQMMSVPGFSGLSSALPPGNGLPQSTMANVVGQNPNLQNIQNMSGVQQASVGNAMGPNTFASQRQIPGRQQLALQQQQQLDMDTSNGRSTQGPHGAIGDSVESGDWKAQLTADSRQSIVNKIMYTLKRHLPFSGHEGLQELKKIAVRFEEKIYTTATSQSDYLRKISLKMLTMETRSQNPMPDAMQANSATNSINPSDPGPQVMPQVNNQGQQLPIPVPSNHVQPGQHKSKISRI